MSVKKLNADYVRKNFPECWAFADRFRKAFGPGVKLVYARENGKEIGKLSTGGIIQKVSDIDFTKPYVKGSRDGK